MRVTGTKASINKLAEKILDIIKISPGDIKSIGYKVQDLNSEIKEVFIAQACYTLAKQNKAYFNWGGILLPGSDPTKKGVKENPNETILLLAPPNTNIMVVEKEVRYVLIYPKNLKETYQCMVGIELCKEEEKIKLYYITTGKPRSPTSWVIPNTKFPYEKLFAVKNQVSVIIIDHISKLHMEAKKELAKHQNKVDLLNKAHKRVVL